MKNYLSFYLQVLIILFSFSMISYANDLDINEIKRKLPLLTSNSNAGKEFWFSIPPNMQIKDGIKDFKNDTNDYVNILVLSNSKTELTIEVEGVGYIEKRTVKPNILEVVHLPPNIAQPFLHNGFQNKAPRAQVYKGRGIHVYANEPIFVYVIVKYFRSSDGFLALPVSRLGKEYVASTGQENSVNNRNSHMPPWINITGIFDNTKVIFTMGGLARNYSKSIATNGKILNPGDSDSLIINKGEVLVYSVEGYNHDITGSKIVSDKPISVVSGHYCGKIPFDSDYCDYFVEMELPTKSWGKTILIPKLPQFNNPGIIRIFSKLPNTDIFKNNSYLTTLNNLGGEENIGWIEKRVWPLSQKESNNKSAVLTSDKPFHIVYGSQASEPTVLRDFYDPFTMTLIPIEQFHNEITFCSPNFQSKDNYDQNYLNVVIETDNNKLIPEDFEFGIFKQEWEWQPIRSMTGLVENFEPFKMYGDTATKYYLSKNLTLPLNGVFKLRCNSRKFISYSYGFSLYESYGYPTATGLTVLNKEDSISSLETDFSKEELFTITPSPIISEGNVNILFNEESLISLKLYDNLGRQVADVFKGKANVGLNTFGISANKLGLTSGVYYLNLISDNLNLMKQILIIE